MVTFRMVGLDRFEVAVIAQEAATTNATRSGLTETAHLIERAAKGQLRRTSHRRGEPTPSGPGDPPSKVSGTLARGVRVEAARMLAKGVWRARVGPTSIYARIQALGGQTGRSGTTTLPARPYVAPAWAEVVPVRMAEVMHRRWSAAQRVT